MKRTLKIILSLILSLGMVLKVNTAKVHAANNPYNSYGGEYYNCTYAAWNLVKKYAGVELPDYTGHAKGWYQGAIDNPRDFYSVSEYPKANSIVVYTNGGNGHVAYVKEVKGDKMYIIEGGYTDGYGNLIGNGYHEEWVNTYGLRYNKDRIVGYIHLGESSSTPKPDAVSNIQLNLNHSSGVLNVSWNAANNISDGYYKIEIRDSNATIITSQTTTNTSVSFQLDNHISQYIIVHAINSGGKSSSADYWFKWLTTPQPDPVTNIKLNITQDGVLKVSWDAANNMGNGYYKIEIRDSNATIITSKITTDTSISFQLDNHISHYIIVHAINSSGKGSSGDYWFRWNNPGKPSAVTNMQVNVDQNTGLLTITWDAAENIGNGYYNVQMRDSNATVVHSETTTETSMTWQLYDHTSRYITVQSMNSGGTSISGDYWFRWQPITKPDAVANVQLDVNHNTGVLTIAWDPANNLRNGYYNIQYRNGNGIVVESKITTETSIEFQTKDYISSYITIQSINSAGTSITKDYWFRREAGKAPLAVGNVNLNLNVENGKLTISWNHATNIFNGYYKIQYRDSEGNIIEEKMIYGTNIEFQVQNHLDSYITIQSINDKGEAFTEPYWFRW